MTKRAKRILFYSAVAVFLLLSYGVILYAEGYAYSFSGNKFVRTGAISLRVSTDAKVYLDEELKGTTSFFNHSFSIDRLLPEDYSLKVRMDNYAVWQKRVRVEEGLVTDFSRIMLVPVSGEEKDKALAEIEEMFKPMPTPSPLPAGGPKPKPSVKPGSTNSPQASPTPVVYDKPFVLQNKTLYKNNDQILEEVAKNVSGFSLSKYNNKLLWWTTNELWVMWLADTDYQPYKKNGDKDIIMKFSSGIKNAGWFRDEDHIVVDSNGYKVLEIDKRGGLNIVKL